MSAGLYYGKLSSNLPNAAQAVELFNQNEYTKMWISEADEDILSALDNQGIAVVLGIPNSKIKELQEDTFAASTWFDETIIQHPTIEFTHIVMGNLSNISDDDARKLMEAMKHMLEAVKSSGKDNIKVTTLVDNSCISPTYNIAASPSKCQFKSPALYKKILQFLKQQDAPLFARVMPYFEMSRIPIQVKPTKDNFLMNVGAKKFLTDQDTTEYEFVFDAMVDSFFGAIKGAGFDLKLVVASGWPRKAQPGDTNATIENAKTYNTNLKEHILTGTPKNGKKFLETFIWSAFDEDNQNLKHEGWKYLGAFVFGWSKVTLP